MSSHPGGTLAIDADCMACQLTQGTLELPGGRIKSTGRWIIEHCIGPLGIGTLIVKPARHITAVSRLDREEAAELGPLLNRAASCVEALTEPDQVYVCLWSHAGWEPVHIHFVIQPSWGHLRDTFTGAGPVLQAEMFKRNVMPVRSEVEAFCDRARSWDGW